MSTPASHRLLAHHVRKHAALAMLGASVMLILLQILFTYLGQVDHVTEDYSYFDAFKYILTQSPRYLFGLLPMAALVGAVTGLSMLASHSELTVMRAAGVSLYRIVFWAVQAALLIAALALVLNQFVIPITNPMGKAIKSPEHISRIGELHGYWQRTDNQVMYVDYASKSGEIQGLKLWQLNKQAKITSLTHAATATHQPESNKWQLNNVSQLSLANHAQLTKKNSDTLTLSLPIRPNMIYLMTQSAEDLAISELYRYNRYMDAQGTPSPEHRLLFWQKLLSPLAIMSLVVIACSFVFGSFRDQSMGLRLVVALLVGLLFNYAQDLFGFMSLAYGAPPLYFVLTPIVLSLLFGFYLLKRRR